MLRALRAALDAGDGWEGTAINYRADGTPFVMSWRMSAVTDGGPVTGYVAIQDDVTETWLAELRVHERIRCCSG